MADPKTAEEAFAHLFPLMKEGAGDYTIRADCFEAFAKGTAENPRGNTKSFEAALKVGAWAKSQAALETTARQHGLMAAAAQRILDIPQQNPPKVVSLEAFATTGRVIRRLCNLTLPAGRGQWCDWP